MADIVWRTTRLPDAIIGIPYEASLAVTGNATAITAASASPSLPTGLSFSADFVRITGTPLKASKGLWTGTITLTDTAGGQASGTLKLLVRFHNPEDLTGDLASITNSLGSSTLVAADLERAWPL